MTDWTISTKYDFKKGRTVITLESDGTKDLSDHDMLAISTALLNGLQQREADRANRRLNRS